ncbi:MAG: DUF547 domain-containing protein [Planctomycetota bacterium]
MRGSQAARVRAEVHGRAWSWGALSWGLLCAVALFAGAATSCRGPVARVAEGHPLTAKVRAGLRDDSGTTFDHAPFTALLQAHVRGARVDYAALAQDRAALSAYLERLAQADVSTLGPSEQTAFFINAYNAYTLELILNHYPLESIRDLADPWKQEICRVAGERVSLDFIEHQVLRVPELLGDPRVHFAVNCASISCPPLQGEAFVGARVEQQLEHAAHATLSDPRYVAVDKSCVRVSPIFDWFAADFVAAKGSVAAFVSGYRPDLTQLAEQGDAALCYFGYDWRLNDIER